MPQTAVVTDFMEFREMTETLGSCENR